MDWYHLFDPATEKIIALVVLVIVFALILYRKINIAYISLTGAGLLIALGIITPDAALWDSMEWRVLTIYWGYGMLAFAFQESRLPAWLGVFILRHVKSEKYILLLLCTLAAVLSAFMANPVVVIILAPLFINIAERLKSSLFLYLVGLAISSNVVTTVTMVADPPALIVAAKTGMQFLDFYWFQGKVGLGTISVFGLIAALLVLLYKFRHLNNRMEGVEEEVKIKSQIPLIIFLVSIVVLSLPVMTAGIPLVNAGTVGFLVGVGSLVYNWKQAKEMHHEFDWNSIFFLLGIFIVIAAVEKVGLLHDFADWLAGTGLKSPAVYLFLFVWLSVLMSAVIDNVPYTVLMIPVCSYVAQNLGVNPFVFYYGMLVGTGIGGNLTPVGATANVLACGMLEKRGYKIELGKFMALSVPFSVAAVAVSHLLIQLFWL
ncbi:MAG: SLC13 family permease [Smithellaceae bacterium]|nr:SLC13 family permease [Smithellaceae bacterium]